MERNCILIIEDSPSLALTYQDYLSRFGYRADIAPTLAAGQRFLADGSYQAILLDLKLPDGEGLTFLSALRQSGSRVPCVVITADPSIESAVAAIRSGAEDFISKPVLPERLEITLKNLLEKERLRTALDSFKNMKREKFCDFVGNSAAMQVVYNIIENAALSRAPVFITGESGTGKELAARAIHQMSQRKTFVFEAINCAAIPATLLESELFGHVRGAFTGAHAARTGAAARAHQGTMFLDEIGEMPMDMQTKLLRFTQTGTFRPVGGSQEVRVDTRFVSATNRDPRQAMKEGIMREDLYYRLNVIPVHLPPLRERAEDVLLIAGEVLRTASAEEGRHFSGFAADAQDYLLTCTWPGNVRQLQNVVRRAVIMYDADLLTRKMLEPAQGVAQGAAPQPGRPASTGAMKMLDIEKGAIEEALRLSGGNITEAARRLGINPSTIHRKMAKWRRQEKAS